MSAGSTTNTFTVPAPDLGVSTTTTIAAGTYTSITVLGGGTGTLAGNVRVSTSATVNSGGILQDGCFVRGGQLYAGGRRQVGGVRRGGH